MQFTRDIPDDFLAEFAKRINFSPAKDADGNDIAPTLSDYQQAVTDWVNANIDGHLVQIAKATEMAKVQPQIDALVASVDEAVAVKLQAVSIEIATPVQAVKI